MQVYRVSHECVQWTNEILSWTQGEKFNISKHHVLLIFVYHTNTFINKKNLTLFIKFLLALFSFTVLNRVSDIISSFDWQSYKHTWKVIVIIIFHMWSYVRFFAVVEIPVKHSSFCNIIREFNLDIKLPS